MAIKTIDPTRPDYAMYRAREAIGYAIDMYLEDSDTRSELYARVRADHAGLSNADAATHTAFASVEAIVDVIRKSFAS